MSTNASPAASTGSVWLRPLAVAVIVLGFAAEGGRVLRESTEQEILIYPIGRASALLFLALVLPVILNLLWRTRTRSQVFRVFLFASIGQIITFGITSALFYSSTHVPSVRDPAKSSRDSAYLAKRPRGFVSRTYVLWAFVVLGLTSPAFLALLLTPTENDAVYIPANGLFQVFPLGLLLALLVSPLTPGISSSGRIAPYTERAAGVRLVGRLFHAISWLSTLIWWTGIVALFVQPAVTNEATYGSHTESMSPIITSLLAGQWEWSAPRLKELKGGPLFFFADMTSTILAVWSSQAESGYAPSLAQAIVLGPPFAIARSMAKMWSDAL
ncbi:uncharacterized protein UTRI_00061 [Ustilago trichophora]|uniref:Uncharacterized protein n=1 Tax=Ustilago trichophora TaxID=86804 RepID=A0A5C3DQF5_9BASI|nr:uncharacterized protein UTRI_00061 [Ustilago trichophora]